MASVLVCMECGSEPVSGECPNCCGIRTLVTRPAYDSMILARDCDGGTVDLAAWAAGFHPDERISLADDVRPGAQALMDEADSIADDADCHARRATTWGDRWHWWKVKESALALAWHISHVAGAPREQETYTSLQHDTPWGVSLECCWQNWMREARGDQAPL